MPSTGKNPISNELTATTAIATTSCNSSGIPVPLTGKNSISNDTRTATTAAATTTTTTTTTAAAAAVATTLLGYRCYIANDNAKGVETASIQT